MEEKKQWIVKIGENEYLLHAESMSNEFFENNISYKIKEDIKILEIENYEESTIDFEKLNLPNLEELSFTIFGLFDLEENVSRKIEDFKITKGNFTKLKKLQITESNLKFNTLDEICNLPNLEELDIDFENNLLIYKDFITKEEITTTLDYLKIEYSEDIIKIDFRKFGLIVKFDDFELFFIYTKKISENKYEFKIGFSKESEKINSIKTEIEKLLLYRGSNILFNEEKIANNNNEFFYDNKLYLSKLEVRKYKKLENFSITDFSPQVNIFLGMNSSGKTTLLQAISLLFSSEGGGYHPNYTNIAEKQFVDIKLNTGKKELEFKKEPYKQNQYNTKIPASFLCLSYCENIFEGEDFEDYPETVENFILGFSKPVKTNSIFRAYSDEIPNPLKVLDLLLERELPSKYLAKYKKIEKLRFLLIKQINKFIEIVLSDNYKIVKERQFHEVKEENTGKLFSLSEMSEGYRANIMLIADIFIEIISSRYSFIYSSLDNLFKEVKGVILIDEFDRHLHPSAQRKFLKGLKEIFPKIQFFLSTHNPTALQSAAGHKSYILTSDAKGKVLAKQLDIKYGYSIETINNLFFEGNNQNYDIYAENDLRKLKELKSEILDGKKEFFDFENLINNNIISKNISEELASYLNFEKHYLLKQLEDKK